MSAPPVRSAAALTIGAILLVAFNLRPSLSSIGPVLDEAIAALALSPAQSAILTTLPVMCLGLCAPLGSAGARRFGLERTALAALAAMTLGMAVRGVATYPAVLGGSLLAAAGVAIGNVLMPSLIKRDFATRLALVTALYSSMASSGTAAGAGWTAPMRHAFEALGCAHAWALALAGWGAPAGLALVLSALVWRGRIGRGATVPGGRMRRVRGLWRDPLAWQVTFYMGLQSSLGYAMMGWLPPMLRWRGDDALTAGWVVSLSVIFQITASLPAPLLSARLRTQSGPAVGSVLLAALAYLGLIWAPLSWQWGLAVAMGVGMGGSWAMALMIILQRAPDGHSAAALSAMSQTVGYLLAALAPLGMGLLHAATGGWNAAAGLVIVLGGGAAVAGLLAGRARLVQVQMAD